MGFSCVVLSGAAQRGGCFETSFLDSISLFLWKKGVLCAPPAILGLLWFVCVADYWPAAKICCPEF